MHADKRRLTGLFLAPHGPALRAETSSSRFRGKTRQKPYCPLSDQTDKTRFPAEPGRRRLPKAAHAAEAKPRLIRVYPCSSVVDYFHTFSFLFVMILCNYLCSSAFIRVHLRFQVLAIQYIKILCSENKWT